MDVYSRFPWLRPFARALVALGFVLLLFWGAPDARALTIGVAESYEGGSSPNSGTPDYRGYTRYDRLVEILEGWKTIGVDFGVLVGDNVANTEIAWPLLLDAIEESGVTVYMALGNHDWVNTKPSGGGSHPDSCFSLKPQEQDPNCPNTIYFLDYLYDNYGYDRPWYSFKQDGVLFVFLADEMVGDWGSASDIHDEQFYWFRDLVATHTGKPIVVFAHHPVYETVLGSQAPWHPTFRNMLGWAPRVGKDVDDTVSVTQGSSVVIRAGEAFDSRRVTVGAEFQIQDETQWYEIASIDGNTLVLTTPYQGTTNSEARFGAGGHMNELTQIMKNPGNSIKAVMTGHTGNDFQAVWQGLSQMEIINSKIFAFVGTISPTDIGNTIWGDFYVGSPTVHLTQNNKSYRILPGALIRTPGGSYIEAIDVSWPDTVGEKSTVTLASNPDIATDHLGTVTRTQRTDPFTETRVLYVDASRPNAAEVVNFNYATGWRSGALLEGSFGSGGFPSADLTDATLEINASTARLTPTSAHGVALYGTHDQHFYSVEARLERVSGGGGGIAFRAQDGSNFYYFEFDESSQTFKLGRCDSGILRELAEVNPGAPLEDDYTLKVRVQGNRIQAFVDGQPAIMLYSPSFPTGRYGLFSRSVAGSDFAKLEVIGDIEVFPASAALVPSLSSFALAILCALLGLAGLRGLRG